MNTPYTMPLGFIGQTTEHGAVFLLTNPGDSLRLNLCTPVTGWRYFRGLLALDRIQLSDPREVRLRTF